MANIRYIVLIALVLLGAVVSVLWQEDDDTPTISFTRPADELDQVRKETPIDQDDLLTDQDSRNRSDALSQNNQTDSALSSSIQQGNTVLSRRDELLASSQEQLTEEELAAQIELAQRQLARVEELNVRKQAQVQQALASESSAEQPLIEAELAYRIGGWRQAWRIGDTSAYFAFYSDVFQPTGGRTIEQWRAERVKRLNPEKPIDLTLENFAVNFDPQTQRSLVTFTQFYKSGDYQDRSEKRLILANEQGQWKIVSETTQ